MNSKEIERLYFEWVDIYKTCKTRSEKATAKGIIYRLSSLLGLI